MSFLLISVKPVPQGVPNQLKVSQGKGSYLVSSSAGNIRLELRKRDDYPRTYCVQLDKRTVSLGYGPRQPGSNEEFLRIVVTADGEMMIERDAFVTLPLFVGCSSGLVVVGNQLGETHKRLPKKTICRAAVLENLVPVERGNTLWNEIHSLGERATLEVADGKAKVRLPDSREWLETKDAPSVTVQEFAVRFAHHLERFSARFLEATPYAYEVSGGLDSSTLPLYHRKMKNFSAVAMGSLIFPGNFEVTQRQKLQALAMPNVPCVQLPLDNPLHLPLSVQLRQAPQAFYCTGGYYHAQMGALAKELAAKGARLVLRGDGGDELFERVASIQRWLKFGTEEKQYRQTRRYPSFLTARAKEEFVQITPLELPRPLPLLSPSTVDYNLTEANVYIEQGLWPLSPFVDIGLYNFCQGIPEALRHNKKIMRVFYEVCGFPEVIYQPVQNEHFGEYMDGVLTSGVYDELVYYYASHSKIAEMGLVDPGILLREYEASKQNTQSYGQFLFYLYVWLCCEMNLSLPLEKL